MRGRTVWLLIGLLLLFPTTICTQDTQESTPEDLVNEKAELAGTVEKSNQVAYHLSSGVGTSVSPLWGVCTLGAYNYFKTDSELRNSLPWYYSPYLFVPGLVILILILLKDVLCSAFPAVKKPMDAAELFENKVSGLIAAPGVVVGLWECFAVPAGGAIAQVLNFIEPVAYASSAAETSTISGTFVLVGGVLVSVVGLIVYAVVWTASNAINVLMLINPIPFGDWVLKGFKSLIIGLSLACTLIHPVLGLIVALSYVLVAFLVVGLAFRLMIFGTINASDILLLRWRRNVGQAASSEIKAFSWRDLKKFVRIPSRTYGRILRASDGSLVFSYRPWLIFPKRSMVLLARDQRIDIGKGLITPSILYPYINKKGRETYFKIFSLPVRYRTHEEAIAPIIGVTSIQYIGIRKGFRNSIQWVRERIRELFGREVIE